MKVRGARWPRHTDGPMYTTAIIDLDNGNEVQVTESPTGRSVQINVRDRHGWRKVYL